MLCDFFGDNVTLRDLLLVVTLFEFSLMTIPPKASASAHPKARKGKVWIKFPDSETELITLKAMNNRNQSEESGEREKVLFGADGKNIFKVNFNFPKFHHAKVFSISITFLSKNKIRRKQLSSIHIPMPSPFIFIFSPSSLSTPHFIDSIIWNLCFFFSFKHGIFHIISVCENHKIPIQLFLLPTKYAWEKFLRYYLPSIWCRALGGVGRDFLPRHQKANKLLARYAITLRSGE